MILYSSTWDIILKLASFSILIVGAVILDLENLIKPALLGLGLSPRAALWVIIAVAGLLWAFLYRSLISILTSWLYGRVSLGANISFSEAKELRRLFQLDLSRTWVPLKEVKSLPRADRRAAIMQALKSIGPTRKGMFI